MSKTTKEFMGEQIVVGDPEHPVTTMCTYFAVAFMRSEDDNEAYVKMLMMLREQAAYSVKMAWTHDRNRVLLANFVNAVDEKFDAKLSPKT
jgi:hypothetical protein